MKIWRIGIICLVRKRRVQSKDNLHIRAWQAISSVCSNVFGRWVTIVNSIAGGNNKKLRLPTKTKLQFIPVRIA